MLLRPWRTHLNVLAIRLLVAPEHRMPELLAEARAVARAQGYDSIVSPLVPASRLQPYLAAGMNDLRPIVALQGTPARALSAIPRPSTIAVRPAHYGDMDALVALDAECFEEFWRNGREEFEEMLDHGRVTVAQEGGSVVGYAACSLAGSACTIGRLGVSAHARRRGVGQALLRDAADWAWRSGALVLSLCTQEQNAASRALYRKAGLFEVEEPYAIVVSGVSSDTHARA
jgi:GNAT superfamily N-acetyltransferase